ncbi:SRPBCC family protein [Rhodococcus ruber]|uniref:Putative Polyketide cyclase/dehydrase n=1 Tax=Rhodococcus ruber TaxID=1830 RepID=A0A098BFD4_9NOCA|nr:SRPBCC family protein [Rhodococcus ruber]MCD2128155.1 SRPBCC family protein [Rhodococcus ruber]MCZ4503398.1 SRPBCC family protein [Rhodococcus ruber]MCZ4530294.1 SRPBCC family protein [Rhodococcus ruber]MCZ4621242.1 SRPBCC family protein [Rhodococcus ruber]MDI9967988.1 SRPBCC family protein [Rhodococcus ruber]
MPTDSATKTIQVDAPLETVLTTIRDIESQTEWIPEILEAEVLEAEEGTGLPHTARFKASATVGTDSYTLTYRHRDDGMSWTMLQGRLQTGQEGRYHLVAVGPDRTSVTYELTIHHNLPLPGFLRNRVIKGLVDSTLTGLKKLVES